MNNEAIEANSIQSNTVTVDQIKDLVNRIDGLEAEVKDLREQVDAEKDDSLSIICFSGDLDKLLAVMIISQGAAALGIEVNLFFTFWSIAALRKKGIKIKNKTFMEKMFGAMLPTGPDGVKLSKMNMMGMGTGMMKSHMKKRNIDNLLEMIESAQDLGVNFFTCDMSMGLMGFSIEELIVGETCEICGVAVFLEKAFESKVSLFI